MGLREKTLIIIALTMLGLIAFVFIASETIMPNSYARLEAQNTRTSLERTLNVLSSELSALDTTAHDWATWDDTYAFVHDPNPEYVRSNLVDKTFINSRLNLMLFLDSSGTVIYGKAFDLQNQTEMQIPPYFRSLSQNDLLLYHPAANSSVSGIILLPHGPMLVASRPILTSEGEGPARGTLILGRYLNLAEANHLAEITGLPIVIYGLDDPQMPSDFRATRSSLSEETPILTRPLSEISIAGYALLKDIYGKPILILRVNMPRDLYRQGQTSVSYLAVSLVAVCLTFGTVTLLLLEVLVLSPLARLSADVSSITLSGDLSTRISMREGDDELSSLGNGINVMLEAIDGAQNTLRASELKYRALFENVPHGVYQSTPEGKLLTANPALVQMLGYGSQEELLAIHDMRDLYVNPEERERWIRTLEKQGALQDTELVLKRKDGRLVTVLDRAHVVRDSRGALLYYEGTVTDITERKRMEDELRQSEEKLRSIFDSSPDAIAVTDLSGKMMECNQATLDLHGFPSKDEAIGTDSLRFIAAKDLERAVASMKRTAVRGFDKNVQYTLVTRDGREFPAEISVGVLRDASGNPEGLVAITKDITERKRMEEELRRYSKHLEDLVEERTRKLRDAERFATIGQVAAMVGHDLRNPLQALVNTLYLVGEAWKTMPPSLAEETKKHGLDCATLVDGMEEQVEYMNKIVSDLQDYARPLTADLAETDLGRLIADTLSTIAVPECIDVDVRIAEDARRITVDRGLMKRAFTNLVTNAVQAMPNGGRLSIGASKVNQTVSIYIQDTGMGIPRENLDKLFIPLFTTKAKGQGFGLPACRRIMEAHSGTITVESTVGKGTTILIEIPLGTGVRRYGREEENPHCGRRQGDSCQPTEDPATKRL